MGVRDDHRIDVFGIEGESGTVAVVLIVVVLVVATLLHAALEQDLFSVMGFNQVAGAGYLAGCSQ